MCCLAFGWVLVLALSTLFEVSYVIRMRFILNQAHNKQFIGWLNMVASLNKVMLVNIHFEFPN